MKEKKQHGQNGHMYQFQSKQLDSQCNVVHSGQSHAIPSALTNGGWMYTKRC